MNKELTPLEVSKQLKDFVLEFVKNGLDRIFVNGSFDIIETTLKQAQKDKKELEEIKNAINQGAMLSQWSHDCHHEKELKVLEIIKETLPVKEEDFFYDKETDTYFFMGYKVSKEKYDLLKEVLL